MEEHGVGMAHGMCFAVEVMAKVKKAREKNENSLLQFLANSYLYIIVCIQPLFFTNYYFNILKSKYLFFCVVAGSLIVLTVLHGLLQRQYTLKLYLREFKFSKWWKSLMLPDKAFLIFILAALISTILSDYSFEAFWGNEGRYNGLFILLLYCSCYFIVTKFSNADQRFLDAFLIVGLLVCLFGITDYFQLNIFGFKNRMLVTERNNYTSTIGNINSYTIYVGLVMTIAFFQFCNCKVFKKSIFYYVVLTIAFFAIIMGISDNAFLGLGALFGFAPLYLLRFREGIKRYLLGLLSFLLAVKITSLLNVVFHDSVIGIDSIFGYLERSSLLLPLILVIAVLAGALYYWDYKKKADVLRKVKPIFSYLWAGLLVLVFLALVFALYTVNTSGSKESFGALGQYLYFDESWGTNRGFAWMSARDLFLDYPLVKKLFGCGPDTYGILTAINNLVLIEGNTVIQFDDAHNIFINYLLTTGICGLAAYVTLVTASLVKMFKNAKKEPMLYAIAFAIIGYLVQQTVTIEPPIVAPQMFTLLMIGIAVCRRQKENKEA